MGNTRRPDKEYVPLVDEVISDHLGGQFHAGLYPLLRDDSCRLLACDFDGPGWTLDALAYLDAARRRRCPCRFGAIPIRRGWPCVGVLR